MTETKSFRGHPFKVLEGALHPAYSLATFDEERDFKDQYWCPSAGEVVLDVGASYGAYSLSALACGARVVALEPEPLVFCDLVRNVAENSWQPRATLLNVGAYSRPMGLDMRTYAPHWPQQTISCEYRMIRLDDLGLGRVDWVKIDVEGAELHVLNGAAGLIRRAGPRPVWIIECHKFLKGCENYVERARGIFEAEAPGAYEFETVERAPCVMLIARPK